MITLYCEFTAQPGFDTIDRILDHYPVSYTHLTLPTILLV